MPLASTIQNALTDTTLSSDWSQGSAGGATLSFSSYCAQINFPNPTSSSTSGNIQRAATDDLTGSFSRIYVINVPTGSTNTDCTFQLMASGSSSNLVAFQWEAGTLFVQKVVAGTPTNLTSFTYNSVTHAWWQIRERGGITFWETSPDGINWTTRFQAANPITLTAINANLTGSSFGVDSGNTPFQFRDYNYPQPGTTTSTSSTSFSSTSSSSTSSSISSTSSSTSISTTSISSTSTSLSTSSTSFSTSSTSSSISSTSSSISSTSSSSTSASTSVSSTSSSISSTSMSSTSQSSTSSSTSISSTSSSFSSTSSSQSSTSASTSSTSFSSTSSSSSTSTTTIPVNLDYSYQDTLTLPTTSTDDIDIDSNKNIQNVAVDDSDYFIQYGSEYMIQEYKKKWTNNTDAPTFTWKGRTTESTLTSPLLIQIYNVNSASWETLARVTNQPADTDFQITVAQSTNVTNYYSSNNTTTFRVYQQVI